MPISGWIRAALGTHKDNVDIGLTLKWILVLGILVLLVYLLARSLLATW